MNQPKENIYSGALTLLAVVLLYAVTKSGYWWVLLLIPVVIIAVRLGWLVWRILHRAIYGH